MPKWNVWAERYVEKRKREYVIFMDKRHYYEEIALVSNFVDIVVFGRWENLHWQIFKDIYSTSGIE